MSAEATKTSEIKNLLLIETIRKKNIHWRTREKATKAIIRLDREKNDNPSNVFNDTNNLRAAFVWSETPEGHNFWHNIYNAKDKE